MSFRRPDTSADGVGLLANILLVRCFNEALSFMISFCPRFLAFCGLTNWVLCLRSLVFLFGICSTAEDRLSRTCDVFVSFGLYKQQVAIVITDGEQTETGGFTPLDEASQGLKDKGVVVYSLGVGGGVKPEQLRQIASSDENVFTSAGFDELIDVVKPIVEQSCPIKPTPSPTPGKRLQPVMHYHACYDNNFNSSLQEDP